MAQHLGCEERIAFGAFGDEPGELRGRFRSHHACDQPTNRGGIETTQRHPGDVVLAAERGQHVGQRMRPIELAFAVGRDDGELRRPGRAHDMAQQQQRGLVGPVEVVEDQQHRRAPRRG